MTLSTGEKLKPASPKTGEVLLQVSEFWSKLSQFDPDQFSQEEKIYIDFAFQFINDASNSLSCDPNLRDEEIEFFRSYNETSKWIRPLSEYLENISKGATKEDKLTSVP